MTRRPIQRLADVLDAIRRARTADQRLQQATQSSDEDGVEIAFDAILHDLFVIGEAVKSLPHDFLDLEPTLPWREIKGMRDVVGHQYHRVDPAVIHATIQDSLGPLELAVGRILAHLQGPDVGGDRGD